MIVLLFLIMLWTVAQGCRQAPRIGQHGISFDVAPQGRTLVFAANGNGERDIYTFDMKSHVVSQVTDTADFEDHPVFAPSGMQIAFSSSSRPGDAAHLMVYSLVDRNRRQVTSAASLCDDMPSFSPDGSRIVFARASQHRPYAFGGYKWDKWDVFVVNKDGSQLRQITHVQYYRIDTPRFSPDGKQIVFSASPLDGETTEIYTVDSDGQQLPKRFPVGRGVSPIFSPDGASIAYLSDKTIKFDYEVWTAKRDGHDPRQVTSNHSYNASPRFLPGGKSLLFLSDPRREARFDLWQVDIDGKNMHRLADSGLFDYPLNWKP